MYLFHELRYISARDLLYIVLYIYENASCLLNTGIKHENNDCRDTASDNHAKVRPRGS